MALGPSTAVVGLTGGIGCGKSTVAARWRAQGALVVDADRVAREVVAPGEPAYHAIVRAFGPEVVAADGALDRKALGARVFADPAERQQLERITHPAIMARTGKLLADAQRAGWRWVVYEAALILETRGKAGLSALVVVGCPPEAQLERLRSRDGFDEAEARRRIAAQTSDEVRRQAADYWIHNDRDVAALEAAADETFAVLVARFGPVGAATERA
jgi:dephospho-CoA kinase